MAFHAMPLYPWHIDGLIWAQLTSSIFGRSRRVKTRRNRNAITIQSIAGMTRMEQNGRELSRGVDQAHEVLNFVGLKFCVGLRRRYCFFALTGWFRQAAFRFEKINASEKILSREKNQNKFELLTYYQKWIFQMSRFFFFDNFDLCSRSDYISWRVFLVWRLLWVFFFDFLFDLSYHHHFSWFQFSQESKYEIKGS